jgi:hypothetical protein
MLCLNLNNLQQQNMQNKLNNFLFAEHEKLCSTILYKTIQRTKKQAQKCVEQSSLGGGEGRGGDI